jgi:molybdopterin/thiamine biosynthesis adenylyltransferase
MLSLDADRFDRLRRIDWWRQDKVAAAKVLVIGAGALGNEALKNLALLGVGNVFVVDMDRVEVSNLSRSVLFRERDCQSPKAAVAARAVREIYPEMRAGCLCGDVRFDLGLGLFRWADVIIAGMDNRDARLWINRCCWKTGRPWVDGATEAFHGVVRVFAPPLGPCYECTLSAAEFEMLAERQGCWGMRPADTPEGVIPTTPVTASVVAAIQCQEALKLLHGRNAMPGKGLVFNGLTNDSYVVAYRVNVDCNSHETFSRVSATGWTVRGTRLGEVLSAAESDLGAGAQVCFNQPILWSLGCPSCGLREDVLRPLSSVPEERVRCGACGSARLPFSSAWADTTSPYLDRTLAELGVPLYDIVAARKGRDEIAYEFDGDASEVLGALWEGADPGGKSHEWRNHRREAD